MRKIGFLCLGMWLSGLIGLFVLVGCAPKYVTVQPPDVDPRLMTPPCKLLPPVSNADEDLAVDVQNAECARQNRLKVYRLQDWVKNVTQK